MQMRFLGTLTVIAGVAELNTFGQLIDLPESLVRDICAVNAPLIPAEQFDEIGFTEAELATFAEPGARHPDTPGYAAFEAKAFAARVALHNYRESLKEAK